ncbi:MAG: hypothetical protein GYA33_05620 [Thermogutta sp.]|nr:hypothetical protein [Thermogutta sp.]
MFHPWKRISAMPRRGGEGMSFPALARRAVPRRGLRVVAASACVAPAVILWAIGGARLLWAEDAGNPPAPATAAAPPSAASGADSRSAAPVPRPMRLREGTALRGLVGSIRPVGDRWTLFLSQRDERYILLENLALERILRTNASFTEVPDWTVEGTVTEFRGQNYLLIEKALIGRVTARPSEP